MTRRFLTTAGAAVLALTLAACGSAVASTDSSGRATTSATGSATSSATSSATTGAVASALADNAEPHAETDDAAYDAADAVQITLSGSGAAVEGSATGVSVDGSTIAISAPGTYVLTGTLDAGQVVVNSTAEGKVRLVLNGAQITSATGSAIQITAADEAVVVLAEGTDNSLTDAATYAGATSDSTEDTDAPNAALHSMADLTLTGTGTLTVTGNANDGIAGKDGLVIQSGTVTVTAVDDGIRGKDYLIVEGGTVSVTAGDDALKSDNEADDTVGYIALLGGTVTLDAGDDGAHAEGELTVGQATVTVERSTEGLEGSAIVIDAGTVSVTAGDDGLNTPQGGDGVSLSGGTVTVSADGDGVDTGGALTITGGTLVVSGPTSNGNGALDADGGVSISGGTLLAAGSSGMAVAPATDSAQPWVSVTFGDVVPAGSVVQVVSGDSVVASYTVAKDTSSVVFSSAALQDGASYDVYVGGTPSGQAIAGLTAAGTVNGAERVATVTEGQHTGGHTGGGPGGGPRA